MLMGYYRQASIWSLQAATQPEKLAAAPYVMQGLSDSRTKPASRSKPGDGVTAKTLGGGTQAKALKPGKPAPLHTGDKKQRSAKGRPALPQVARPTVIADPAALKRPSLRTRAEGGRKRRKK